MRFKKAISLIMSVSLVASMAAVNLSAVETRDNTSLTDNLQISSQKNTNVTADETVIELSLEEFQQYKSISTYTTVPDNSTTASYDEDAIYKHICENMTNVPTVSDPIIKFTPSGGGTKQGKKCRRIDLSQFNIKAADYPIAFDLLFKAFDQRPEIFNRDDDFGMIASQNQNSNGEDIVVAVSYPYLEPDTAKAQEMQNELDAKVNEITTQASECGTDIEKLLYVYNSLINTITYTKEKPIPSVSRNVYNALVKGDSVCDGYAKSLKYILNQLNIPAERVVSVGNGGMNHAWNVVQIGDKWYYCDLTWDDPDIDGRTRGYKYFMKSEEEFRNDPTNKHYANDWTISNVPIAETGKQPNEAYTGEKFWKDSCFVMPYVNGTWYVGRNSADNPKSYSIVAYKGGTITESVPVVNETDLIWNTLNGRYYTDKYIAVIVYGDRLYYSTQNQVKSVKLDGTDPKVEYTLTQEEMAIGRIYAMRATGSTLTYEIMADPSVQQATKSGAINMQKIAEFTGYSATLSNDICINFFIKVNTEEIHDNNEYDYIIFKKPNKSTADKILFDNQNLVNDGTKTYKIACHMVAKEMADEITAEVYNDGELVATNTISIKDYAAKVTNPGDKSIAKAMLNYGAAAQIFFNYNTDNLANSNLIEADKAIVSTIDTFKDSKFTWPTTMPDGIKYYGNSLHLDSNVGLMHYFSFDAGKKIEDYTFKVGQEVLTPTQSGKYYVVEIPVFANALDKPFTLTVSDKANTKGTEISYSAYMYAHDMIDNQKYPNLDKLLCTMADYCKTIHDAHKSADDLYPF